MEAVGLPVFLFLSPVLLRRTADPQSSRVRGGSLIRLFHKELEGYVAAEGVFGDAVEENVHLRIRQLNPGSLWSAVV